MKFEPTSTKLFLYHVTCYQSTTPPQRSGY